jgi:carbon monoxide dehydrogenase subunit G
MTEISETRDVSAPAPAVWDVISDIAALPDVLSGMTGLVVEGHDPALRVGLEWTQTRVISGRTGSERLRVTRVDDRVGYVTEGGGHGFDYRMTWTVSSTGANTSRIECRFLAVPRTRFARVLLKVFGGLGNGATRAAMRRDLDDIARAATGAA